MSALQTYQPLYPFNADMVFLKRIHKEYFLRFPLLKYRSLNDITSTPHDFYLQANRTERAYTDYSFNIRPGIGTANSEYILTHHGIDKPKLQNFYICFPVFEEIPLSPKIGDVIIWEYIEEQEYEVMLIRKPTENYYAHSNYCFERELVTSRPVPGD